MNFKKLKYFFTIYGNHTYKLIMPSKYILFGNFTLKETKKIMDNTSSEIFPAYIRFKYFNPCLRCGRDGHHYFDCYSKNTVANIPINDGWNQFIFSEREVNVWLKNQKEQEKEKRKIQALKPAPIITQEQSLEDLAMKMALEYSYRATSAMLAQQALSYYR